LKAKPALYFCKDGKATWAYKENSDKW
jgi:hypothetical protein